MKVTKFDEAIRGALARLGFEIADDHESAEANCRASIIQPDGGMKLLIEIYTPGGEYFVARTIDRYAVLAAAGADDEEDEVA